MYKIAFSCPLFLGVVTKITHVTSEFHFFKRRTRRVYICNSCKQLQILLSVTINNDLSADSRIPSRPLACRPGKASVRENFD